jgi:phosphoglucosamine mutase
MAKQLFGTDGIRGTVNAAPMTAEMALRVGMAAGRVFTRGYHRHRVVIGKDTRLSGYMIEPALVAGFTAVGMDVFQFGPLPTPAVAMLTRSLRADLGVMISASHNTYHDNGIKLFGPDGFKLSDDIELQIERLVANGLDKGLAKPADLGRAKRIEDAQARYIEFVKGTFPKKLRLEKIKIVVDCANGAAYKVGPAALWELGADVIPIGVKPDGFNINKDYGSTAPLRVCEAVKHEGADIGIAFDGDADRVIIVDQKGRIVDGDQVMSLIAVSWSKRDRLSADGVVGTVMSNLGMENHLKSLGLNLVRAQVGDRYVVECMKRHGYNLGGEQSGHIILSDFSTTGDGLIAALQVLAVIQESGLPVSEACRVFEPCPQIIKNVHYTNGSPLKDARVKQAISAGKIRLGKAGQLVIRESGTEPLIRVMAQGNNERMIDEVVDEIVGALERVVV